jgi:hypothetical protein
VSQDPVTETASAPLAARALAWSGLAAIAAGPPAAAWLAGKTMAYRDTAALYGPTRGLVTEALREGRLPLWNPFEGTGKPLFAEGIHGVLHPLSLLAAAVDPGGVDLLVALYLVAAALGAAVLARELGLGRPQALVAGLAFGLSGFVVSMAGNLVFLAGAASMPWQVAALAAAGRGARLGVPLAALATAVTAFSGDAQVAAVSALLGAALAAERGGWRGAGRAAGGTVLGVLLAAVQIVPTLAAVGLSARSGGLQDLEGRVFAFSPWRLPELAVPGLFVRFDAIDSPSVYRWLGGPADAAYDLPFAASVHVGVPVLALAASAPLRDRRVRVLAAAAAASLWLALGHFAGARQALGGIPIWGLFRYAEKLVAPLGLALALLAAFGARGAAGAGPDRRRVAVAALACVAVALGVLGVASALPAPPEPARAMLVGNVLAGLPLTALGAAAIVAATWLPPARGLRGAGACAAVAVALVAALPSARLLLPREPCRTWPGALAAEPPGPRLIVPYLSTIVPHASFGERAPSGGEVMIHDECGRARLGMPAEAVRDRVGTFWSYGGLGSRRLSLLVSTLPDGGAASSRWFSVTHVSVIEPSDDREAALGRLATAGGTLVAEDPEYPLALFAVPHLPWARFAPAVKVVGGPEAAAGAFAAVVASGADVAVVESGAPVPAGRGTVRSVSRRPERVDVEVDALEEGLLVVNDAWWPGWTARVDGRAAPVLATNVISRGVVVPQGRHVVTMEYAPPELAAGAALSLLGVAACAALAAVEARRGARRSRRLV